MNQTVTGGLSGSIAAIGSKSRAHRLLICAALSSQPCTVRCAARSEDILATVRCLRALGARIDNTGEGFAVTPLRRGAVPAGAVLDCGESGSTLRFLLPVACALGAPVRLMQAGRLPQRPLSPLYEVLTAHGARLGAPGSNPLAAAGPLTGTDFTIDASVSSQFVSGLLFALPLLGGGRVNLTGRVESAAYLDLTAEALTLAGVTVLPGDGGYTVRGDYAMPPRCQVEGDWSNAAFWLCAGAIGGRPVTVTGLRCDSSQGDRAVAALLRRFGARVDESAAGVTAAPGPLRGADSRPGAGAGRGGCRGGRNHRAGPCGPPAPEGERPPAIHGGDAHRPGQPGGGAAGRPAHLRRAPPDRRGGGSLRRPPYRHGGGRAGPDRPRGNPRHP